MQNFTPTTGQGKILLFFSPGPVLNEKYNGKMKYYLMMAMYGVFIGDNMSCFPYWQEVKNTKSDLLGRCR